MLSRPSACCARATADEDPPPSPSPVSQDFERKSALFSLASSEVLLINIWEHQVGLYQGANMGLLKTVFEVNLGLFGQAKTSCVLLLPPALPRSAEALD